MPYHSQEVAAVLMIPSSPQQHTLNGSTALPRLVIISDLSMMMQKKKKKQQQQQQQQHCSVSLIQANAKPAEYDDFHSVTPVSTCSDCTISRARTKLASKSQEPTAAQTLAGYCLICA